MQQKSFTVVLAIATLLSVSCAEEALEGNSRLRTETITADMPEDMGQPGTRTCIDLNSSDNGTTGLLWQSSDIIGVYGQQGTTCNAPFACQATTNQAQATFSGQVAEGDPSYRAYYPYSAENNGVDIDHLKGCLPKEQPFDLVTGKLTGDYKYGAPVGNTKRFTFRHLFSMLRVSVNAEGTFLEGDNLDRIILSVKDDKGNPRGVCGSFTFSARNGAWDNLTQTSNSIVMPWTSAPQLTSGATYQGFITILPTVMTGDQISITVLTDKHKAEFTAPCLVDFVAENIYNIPLTLNEYSKILKVYDQDGKLVYPEPTPEPTVTTGTFTACAFNVDGLPSIVNSDGPGKSGTTTMAGIANNRGWDIIAASEDFEYNTQLENGLSNYSHGTYRGSVGIGQAFGSTADTDGLNFFWRKSTTSATGETYVQYSDAEGDLLNGANTCIKKGFRHYEVTVDKTNNVVIDVYITHMNTYSGSGNTESNAYVKAVLSQLRQLRDYVLEKAQANKRPAIIMGDTNMRYTRHDIKTNFLDVVEEAGYTVSDPWVEFHRGGVYPQWNSLSLMTRFAFAGDKTNDIVCADNQCGEVVDKIWYINVPGAEVQLKATAHENDVDHFRKSTSNVSYSGVMVEDENGTNTSGNTKYNSGQTVSYTKDVGYSDHFPVVTTFEWTKTVVAEQ